MCEKLKALTKSLKSGFPSLVKEYEAEFSTVVDDIIRVTKENDSSLAPDIEARLRKLFVYNIPHQNTIRGVAIPLIYNATVKEKKKEDELLLFKLGWIFQIQQTYFVISDDVLDGASTRWNQDCWYINQKSFHEHVIINDLALLEYCAYALLMEYFQDDPNFSSFCVKTFFKASLKCALGQNMDITAESKTRNGINNEMTMGEYRQMIYMKSGYPFIYVPICLALQFCGVTQAENQKLWELVHTLAMEIGAIFQMQDDYLDSFGSPDRREQHLDIKSGKKSWLYLQASQLADENQKKILFDSYGSYEEDKVAKVMEVYEELKLEKMFKKYEEDFVERLGKMLVELCGEPNGTGIAAALKILIDNIGEMTE